MTDDPSFASRWSRRKQAVKDEALEHEKEASEEIVVEEIQEEPEKTDAEILTEFNLKDPDDMESGDDFSAFMDSAIPQRLRNRALRKLWLSNPALANLDELLDYGEDFNKGSELVENIATAYKVGKGFVDKLLEDEETVPEVAELTPADEVDEVEVAAKTEDKAPSRNVRKPDDVRVKAPLPTESNLVISQEVSTKSAETRRKRMNFKF